jgi:hypothetical protein
LFCCFAKLDSLQSTKDFGLWNNQQDCKIQKKSAGELSCTLKLFKVLKRFPQIAADYHADCSRLPRRLPQILPEKF